MKKSKGLLMLLAAAAIVAGGAGTAETAKAAQTENTIPENVYIEGVSVGGMTEDEAESVAEEYVNKYIDDEFTLRAAGNSITVTAQELGIQWGNTELVKDALNLGKTGNLVARYKAQQDLQHENKEYEVVFTADEAKVKELLETNKEQLDQEAIDNGLTRENGSFVIVEGSEGIVVNIEKSAEEINEFLANEWTETNTVIDLAVDVEQPKGTVEELEKVKDSLGTFSTDFSSSAAGRAKNVRNGAEKINGTVVYPGDEFSVYDMVQPFNAENGYELAGSYENGTTVETYGGGICQVSTTLYNAVIRAELEITERYSHSMIVTYVDPSADAAIAGTSKNLRFVNSTDAPIYIEGYTSGGIITFTIYGEETREDGRSVSFVSETTSETDPGVEFTATADPIGYVSQVQSAHVGKTAILWKVVSVGGVEQSRTEFNKSTYKASPKIIEVGVGSDNPTAVAAIQAAIATGDEATIRAAAAANSAEAIAAQAAAQAEADAAAAAAKDAKDEEDEKEDSKKDSDKKESEDDNEDSSDNDNSSEKQSSGSTTEETE